MDGKLDLQVGRVDRKSQKQFSLDVKMKTYLKLSPSWTNHAASLLIASLLAAFILPTNTSRAGIYSPAGDVELKALVLAQDALATADWYFPTLSYDVPAGVIWLQRDGVENAVWFARLATEIAQQTQSIVVAPKFRRLDKPSPSVDGDTLAKAVAELFLGDRLALNSSAAAAGYQGPLPQKFLLVGIGKGGGFATSVGGYTVDNGAAANLLGVVMLNGAAKQDPFAPSLAKLDSVGIPDYQIAGSGFGVSNGRALSTAKLLKRQHPGQFVGIQIWPGATDAEVTTSVGWINDIYAGYGPTDPQFGIYGNPNDGTYIPGQLIMIDQRKAKVL